MRNLALAFALALTACPSPSPTPTPTSTPTPAGPRFITVPTDADVLSAIRTETQRAKKEGRVALVYLGATWCPPCRRLHDAIESGAGNAKLANVTLLAFDVDRDGDRLDALGYKSKYIPFFAVPRPDGRASDQKMDTSFEKTASGEEVIEGLAAFVATIR
jgi:thiol-disulfide isomerase/thioredoxin